jgi:hypothetical protein
MDWSGCDLNLVVVFEAVGHEKNPPRAGQRLGMSQPPVSDALAASPKLNATTPAPSATAIGNTKRMRRERAKAV